MKNGPYILVKAPDEYFGKKYRGKYIYEHQLIWWQNTNIIPPIGYQIHHKNENKHDNRFQNLEMVCKSTHAKVHGKYKKKKLMSFLCPTCNKTFIREKRYYDMKKKYQKSFHCSKSCSVKNQMKLLHRSSVGS